MSNVTLFGFPRSTFVSVVGLILTAKGVPYTFHNTEEEMYLPIHLQRHPFGRVPALQHDPEKWERAFRKGHAQTKRDEIMTGFNLIEP